MDKLLAALFSRVVRRGALRVTTARGKALTFGDGTGAPVAIRFTTAKAERALLIDPEMKLGEIFTGGGLEMEQGRVYDFLKIMLRDSGGVPSAFERVFNAARHAVRRLVNNSKVKARDNVHHHYDLEAGLYDLFLDKDRQYSCAYFETPGLTLDEAQLAKKRHIAAKLCVDPGMSVLDIGCGWGGMALYLSGAAQAGRVRGVTLSDEQIKIAQARAVEAGLADKVTFALEDYRDTKGTFDRIVSVGMFEHVGIAHYAEFFKRIRELMNEDGVMLLHTIGCSDGPNHPNPWLDRYIFPGGYLPALSEMLPLIERAGLIVTDIEVWRLHYARTLEIWRERFLARRGEAVKLYDERFCRMWEYYLSMAQTAFEHQDVAVFQLQIARRQSVVPLTRDYIETRKMALRTRELTQAP